MNTHKGLCKVAWVEMKAGRPIMRENTATQTTSCSITMLYGFKTLVMSASPKETPFSELPWALDMGRGSWHNTSTTD